jgi:hypothetical protein
MSTKGMHRHATITLRIHTNLGTTQLFLQVPFSSFSCPTPPPTTPPPPEPAILCRLLADNLRNSINCINGAGARATVAVPCCTPTSPFLLASLQACPRTTPSRAVSPTAVPAATSSIPPPRRSHKARRHASVWVALTWWPGTTRQSRWVEAWTWLLLGKGACPLVDHCTCSVCHLQKRLESYFLTTKKLSSYYW